LHNHEHERWPDQVHAPNNHQDPEFRPTTAKPRVGNEERKTQADDRRQRRENAQQPHRWPRTRSRGIDRDRQV
jgi:hypothetical protein